AELAAVAGVDEPGAVDDRDPVFGGKAGPGLDEAGITVWDRDGEPGRNRRALTRSQLVLVAGAEVEAGVPGIGAGRQDGVVPTPHDRQRDRRVEVARSCLASATRYGAKRLTSRRGSRARMNTPSASSRRSSIGAPSEYSSASFAPS